MRKADGFSLIELLIVVAIILIIAGIAVPNLLRSRIAANEASAVSTLRTIASANATYHTAYNIGYAGTLVNLGPSSSPTSAAADLLDAALGVASPINSGYAFTYSAANAAPTRAAPNQSYSATGAPTAAGSSGTSTLCVDQTGVVGRNPLGTAPGNTASGCNYTITSPL
jgi:prepilin-type N-terminal cleavage/methylation domain-containing protein